LPNTKKIVPGESRITKDKGRFYVNSIRSDYDVFKNAYDIEADDYASRNFEQAGLLPSDYTKKTQAARLPNEAYFQDPYPQKYKARLAQANEFDYSINSGVEVLIHYILGRDIKATIYPTIRNQLNNEDEISKALTDAGLNEKERKDLQNYIDYVDLNCELRSFLKGALAQCFTYGRSALWIKRAKKDIETFPELFDLGFREGTPTQILPLNSYYMGQITVDKDTWEPTSVLYEEGSIFGIDPKSGRPFTKYDMPIEDLIYFTHKNYNIVPKSYNYGMSLLQSVIPVSEVNRRLNERVFPEINTSQWAGSGIIKFEGLNQRDMESFTQSMMNPGNWKATNQSFQLETYKLNVNGGFLLEQRNENIRQILMQLRIPSVLMNFENVANRATTEAVIAVWQETVLESYRDWLRETMWKQWYRPLMENFFGGEKPFIYLKAKIIMEFQSIDFSSLIEKAVSVSNLVQTVIITVREARELLKLPPFPPDQAELMNKTAALLAQNPDMAQQPQGQMDQQQKAGLNQNQPQQGKTGGGGKQIKLNKSAASGDIGAKIVKKEINKAKNVGKRA
jgi:hypothetical protein